MNVLFGLGGELNELCFSGTRPLEREQSYMSKPPVEAAAIQVCFPCSASPSTTPTVTDTFLNSLVTLIVVSIDAETHGAQMTWCVLFGRTASFLKKLLQFYDKQEPPMKGERATVSFRAGLRRSIDCWPVLSALPVLIVLRCQV